MNIILKTTTLTLKYLLRQKRFRLVIFRLCDGRIAYGVQLDDDPDYPATIWSIFEFPDEVAGAANLTHSSKCVVFLFNELALNVAWGDAEINLSSDSAKIILRDVQQGPLGDTSYSDEVHTTLDKLRGGLFDPSDGIMLNWSEIPEWHPLTNHYITNRAQTSLVSIFETDEGRQQEEMALWLTDNLHPEGAIRSPQVSEEAKMRELSDLLLSYENGYFLIESKALGIWMRDELPTRTKLARAVGKHIHKAAGQLIGGVKNIRRGLRVTDTQNNEIRVEHSHTPHVIVLIPDLNLLWSATEFGADFFRKMIVELKGYFHILDPAELLRIVQAAEMIAARGESTTPMMAFDYYLMERAKRALTAATPEFRVLLRIEE